MKFNLNDYVMVEDRIRDFYDKFPTGRIETKLVQATDNLESVVVFASIYKDDAAVQPLATGLAQEEKGQGGFANEYSWVENAETSAIGRALANAGFQKKGEPRPSQEEMTKKDRVAGGTDKKTYGDTKPPVPVKKNPPSKQTVNELKVTTNMKNLVFNMCNENKEFARTTYESAYKLVTLKGADKNVENWDTQQQGKFLDEAEKVVARYAEEGSQMKEWDSMTGVEKIESVFTKGTVEKTGDDMADIPSGKWEQDPMSDAQANFMDTLINECIDAGGSAELVAQEAKAKVNSGEMTKKLASEWIDKLKEAKS